MQKTYSYRGHVSQLEGIIAFILMAAWSIGTIVLAGSQSGAIA